MKPNVRVTRFSPAKAVQTATGFEASPAEVIGSVRGILAPLGLRERASERGSQWQASHKLTLVNALDLQPSDVVQIDWDGRHARTAKAKVVEVTRDFYTFTVLIG